MPALPSNVIELRPAVYVARGAGARRRLIASRSYAWPVSVPASTAEWLAANPPPSDAFKQSLAGVARRVRAGEPFDLATRELLDELALLRSDDQRRRALADEPRADR